VQQAAIETFGTPAERPGGAEAEFPPDMAVGKRRQEGEEDRAGDLRAIPESQSQESLGSAS